jgi:hypothetical protein
MNEKSAQTIGAGIAERAERIYAERLKAHLELTHRNDFVAIEPISGDHFVAATLSEAIQAARKAHPDRLSYAIRVGHSTAVHLGTCHP